MNTSASNSAKQRHTSAPPSATERQTASQPVVALHPREWFRRHELITSLGISARTFDRRLKAGDIEKEDTLAGARYRLVTPDDASAKQRQEEVTPDDASATERQIAPNSAILEALMRSEFERGQLQADNDRLRAELAETLAEVDRLIGFVGDITTEQLELERRLALMAR